MDEIAAELQETLITHTTDIVVSYVSNNSLSADVVSSLIQNIYGTLSGLGQQGPAVEERPEPAVSIRSSVKRDHIVCLEDGKKMKMLKRHLMTDHGLTPDNTAPVGDCRRTIRWSHPTTPTSAAISPRRSGSAGSRVSAAAGARRLRPERGGPTGPS